MSEILQIFHQSPPSHPKLHTHQGHLMNCSSLLDSDFPYYEFGDTCFTNFTNSSIDELSPILDQNQSLKKRKLEFGVVEVDSRKPSVECDSKFIEPPRAKKNAPNENSKPKIDIKHDCIHVRARRGEATDSHSIAERARREKLKNKMQILQDLVPGCDKITNKAAILDEIITYVQCLQSDVEILKMKLVALTRLGDGQSVD